MLNFNELVNQVVEWGVARNLCPSSNNLVQQSSPQKTLDQLSKKTREEVEELIIEVEAYIEKKDGDVSKIVLEAGDVFVTLIIALANMGLTPTYCLNQAYEKIKNRTGKTVGNVFIKD